MIYACWELGKVIESKICVVYFSFHFTQKMEKKKEALEKQTIAKWLGKNFPNQ